MTPDRQLSLDEKVLTVNFVVRIMPDMCELFVNDVSYASAYRCAGDEALAKVQDVHAIAQEALHSNWTVREMNQALFRLRQSVT